MISAPSSVGSKFLNDAGSTTLVLTLTAAVAVGQKVICGMGCQTAGTTAAFSDSKGNTWATDATANATQAACFFIGSSDITIALTTADTITVTLSVSRTHRQMAAVQVSGLAKGAPDEVAAGASATAAWSSGATATTDTALELLIGGSHYDAGAVSTSTPDAGWTELFDFNDASNNGLTMAYQITNAAGAYTASGTWTGAAPNNSAIATYRAALDAIEPAFQAIPLMEVVTT